MLRDEAGATVGFVKVLHDRTEQHQADADLRDSQQRLAALVSASSEVIYSMSWGELSQLTSNGSLADSRAANPKWLTDLHPFRGQAPTSSCIGKAIQSNGMFELEHRVRRVEDSVPGPCRAPCRSLMRTA